ncbi:MAG: hypothetical protein JST92_17595 [Deltaproteobacteria bacterium]|nr:hypothetical protein [Deltaproteobacteria bacterium]
MRRLLTTALVLFTAACSRELSLPPPIPTTGSLSGNAVLEVPGTNQVQPAPGAVISVQGTNVHGVADSNGAFVVGPLPAGSYSLLLDLRAPGDKERQLEIDNILVVAGATKALGNFALRRNAQVRGRVLINGLPSGNAGITVFVPGTGFTTATADNGE